MDKTKSADEDNVCLSPPLKLAKSRSEDENGGGVAEKCYLYVVPEEMWVHIFEKLSSSIDLSSCAKACPLWKRILSDRSPFELNFDDIYQHISPFLKKENILQMRAVNSVWKKAVDDLAVSRLEVVPFDSNKHSNINKGIELFWATHPLKRVQQRNFETPNFHWVVISRSSQLTRFYEHFGSGSRNPFISRSVHLYVFATPDDKPNFMLNETAAIAFLSQFGTHIWNIVLGGLWWNSVQNREKSLVTYVCDCLAQLPNLKYLDFAFVMEKNPSGFKESILTNLLVENPLPRLEKLETLRIVPSPTMLFVQLDLLTKHATQLKRLDLLDDEHRHTPWARIPQTPFPVLKELNMSMDIVTLALNVLSTFEKSPLETLLIEIKSPVNPEKVQMLVEMITNKFGETLRVLYLGMNHLPSDTTAAPPVKVQIPPNLASLTLSGCSNLSFDSLLLTPSLTSSLKHLTLEVKECNLPLIRHPDERIDVRELITFYVPPHQVYFSNIWTLLPNLQRLNCHVMWKKRMIFTREMHLFNTNE